MVDNKLAQDEAQRTANFEEIKNEVSSEVGGAIVEEVRNSNVSDTEKIEDAADTMRRKATGEVLATANEVGRARAVARISQVIDYFFFIVYGLLAIRLILALFAANSSNGFVQFIRGVTDPIYAPFKGIVPSLSIEGGFTLVLPIVVALIVYGLLHLAINGFLRIFAHRKIAV